ncbi:MAG: EpsI family protein [Verrucomicrobiota bacterium]
MRIHPLLLPILLGGMLATVHLLPAAGEMAKSAVNMELPSKAGAWEFRPLPVSEEELKILSADTSFSKAYCLRAREGEVDLASGMAIPDRIDLSVVLSGHDLNNSIHRPERCMPAQGHVIGNSSNVEITLSEGRTFTVKRLLSVHTIPTNEARTEFVSFNCVTYYFFVGHDSITQDHLKRTLVDMKDRLLHGMDQRWAYVSASMWYGKVPWIEEKVSIKEADTKVRQFIVEFGEKQIDWNMIGK